MLGACNPGHDHRKDHTEVEIELRNLGKDAKVAFITNDHFPKGKAATLPESAGPSCCGNPDNKCKASRAWDSDPVWKELVFEIDEPTLFRYSYESTDGQSFTATAVGDLDCDGKTITYTLHGTVTDGNPATTLDQPPSNAD